MVFHILSTLFFLVLFLSSCSSGLRNEMARLQIEADSLTSQIGKLHEESKAIDLQWWQLKYEIEYLRNAVVKSDADSVKKFFIDYVFRFRRPVLAWVEPDRQSPFRFPLKIAVENEKWIVPITWGRLFYFDYNHLGIDLHAVEGDTVRAIYDGTVINYEGAPGYGELVVVIEHEYQEPWKKTSLPVRFLSIYGHLRAQAIRDSSQFLAWKKGDRVRRGDVIGFVNDDDHNGDGDEHVHLGIRLQTSEDARRNGKWLRGYDDRDGNHLQYFMNPMELFGRYVRFEFQE